MTRALSAPIEQQVRARAADACEYCRLPQLASPLTFPIDHVIARQHDGDDSLDNLALACQFCNGKKGPNIAGLDPGTGQLTRLYHPRRDRWADHFAWTPPAISGITPEGRATVAVLGMNHPAQRVARQAAADAGLLRLPS